MFQAVDQAVRRLAMEVLNNEDALKQMPYHEDFDVFDAVHIVVQVRTAWSSILDLRVINEGDSSSSLLCKKKVEPCFHIRCNALQALQTVMRNLSPDAARWTAFSQISTRRTNLCSS
jgi:hypothetical protein